MWAIVSSTTRRARACTSAGRSLQASLAANSATSASIALTSWKLVNRDDDQDPHVRLSTRWLFHPNLYLMGGYDDFLEDDSFFLGGGIRWRDDYLKYLLGSVPIR